MLSKKVKNIKGKKFGRLSVVDFSHCNQAGDAYWICLCECGKSKAIAGASVRRGSTVSCGCYQKERAKEQQTKLSQKKKTHGMGQSRFYNTWYHMVERCTIRGKKDSKNYIERGITVDERWKDFSRFKEDMYLSYVEHCTLHGKTQTELDRVNNDKGYSPENCRWATKKQQARNKRTNTYLCWSGEKKCIAEWADITGICPFAISKRIRRGWSVEKTLTTPVKTGSYRI